MTIGLNKIELDITKEIINIGIAKAADSLSFFIKEKVLIRLLEIQVNSRDYFPISRKNHLTNKNYLLTTEIKGVMKGKAYLIFNEQETEKIGAANLPESIRNNEVEKAKMTEAILLEIDNIITGAVVTQFSNIFQCKIYGDVPSLNILAAQDINHHLSVHHDQGLNVIYFNARFITKDETEITPEFIWLMDDTFFNEVKNVVSDEKKMELFQKLNNTI